MNILDFVIPVLIIIVSVFLSAKKKDKKVLSYELYHDDENSEWDDLADASKWETILQKTAKNAPNSSFYDNLEKIENREKESHKNEVISMQEVELEREQNELFLISQEEMRKAVIYAEILKRPYFE